MGEMLPLFPLGAVLYPGMLLPLHIFEERYRQLVADLLDGAEPRRFGVIAIRKGRETGIDGVHSLYKVGCTATLRRVNRHDDGRFDALTLGTQRFRLLRLDQTRPYLQGEVEILAGEEPGRPGDGPAVRAIQAAFREYLDALTEWGGATVRLEELPDEPELLSLIVAAAVVIDLPERQAMLAEPDTLRRLAMQRALSRETAMLRTTTWPAPGSQEHAVQPELGRTGEHTTGIRGRGRPWQNRKPRAPTFRCAPPR